MSRTPKFADPKKPRGLCATPTFKYYVVASITLAGIWFAASYCIYSTLLEKRVKRFLSKYKSIDPPVDMVESMVLQKLILRHLEKQEKEAKNK